MKTSQEFLQACTVEGLTVKVPTQSVDRNVFLEAKKALELIGGKWKGGSVWGFQFRTDPTELLQSIQGGEKRNLKKEYQFFATPSDLAREMAMLLSAHSDDRILEPSAGQGALIDAVVGELNSLNIKHIFYCEKMIQNQMILKEKYRSVEYLYDLRPASDDFLKLDDTQQFDRIIANPPFTGNQDIDHILKMYTVCAPGGRIVTLSSTHWNMSQNKKEKQFKEWLYNEVDASVEMVESGAFEKSGTKVGAYLITIDK